MGYSLSVPVKYLMNVPKNDLVFSLHVLRYALGAHRAHVALQKNFKKLLMSSCTNNNIFFFFKRRASVTSPASLSFQRREFLSEPTHLRSYFRQQRGDGWSCNIILLK